jgi:hypothetical protein
MATGNLALQSQTAFGDADGLLFWAQAHEESHQSYVKKLVATYSIKPPSFDLIDEGAMADWIEAMRKGPEGFMTDRLRNWLLAHDRMHQAELAALKYTGPTNITTADFRNEDQFYGWMLDHQQLHDAEDTVLT